MSGATTALLGGMLLLAVPLRVAEVRGWDEELRAARRQAAADTLAAHGDDLQFKGKHTREAFAACVDAVALLSFAPGGVTFAGICFCATHGADALQRGGRCARCVEEGRDDVGA